MKKNKLLLITAAAVILSTDISAELLHLKNGKMLTGRVIGQNVTSVEFRTDTGRQWISKKDINKIIYQPKTIAEIEARKAALRKKREEQRLARLKIEQEAKEKAEKEKLLQELAEKEKQEALEIAREQARRAEALRELVENETMNKPEDEPISYWDFAWRSMVLPGWGHYYLERPAFGTFYSAGTAFLLLNVYRARQDALLAKSKNDEEVRNNFILTAFPQTGPQGARALYSLEANRRAFFDYQKKVDIYNYSMILLASFYAFQFVHIIYNGIAWENGIPVVENTENKQIRFSGMVLPENDPENNSMKPAGFAGITYTF